MNKQQACEEVIKHGLHKLDDPIDVITFIENNYKRDNRGAMTTATALLRLAEKELSYTRNLVGTILEMPDTLTSLVENPGCPIIKGGNEAELKLGLDIYNACAKYVTLYNKENLES